MDAPYIAEGLRHLAVPIDTLNPDPKNARSHNDENRAAIAGSLRRFGQRLPLVVQREGMIVRAGNGRLDVMREMGWTHVAALVVDEADADAAAFALADNRSAELAEWNDETLAALLRTLPQDVRCDVGFSDSDMANLLGKLGLSTVSETDPDDIPAQPDAATTQPGDIWVLGNHRLMCGDSSRTNDLDRLLDGARIHLVNTDPPYNVKVEPRSDIALASGMKGMPGGGQYEKIRTGTLNAGLIRPKDRRLDNDFRTDADFEQFMTGVVANLGRALIPGRAFYVWCGAFPSNAGGPANTESFPKLFRDHDMRYAQMIVWDKGHGILGRKDFMTQYEVCLYGWKSGAGHEWYGPNNITDLWSVKRVTQSKMVHLTEKPVELAARAIEYSSKPGENVLDLFGGSGSTLIACEQHGRRAFLMELDALYCDVIVTRWENFTKRKAERIPADGQAGEKAPAKAEASKPAKDPPVTPRRRKAQPQPS